MKKNVGTCDKVVRIVIALVIGGLCYAQIIEGTLAIILAVMAGVFVLTSLISFCPLYAIFGWKTNCCGKCEDSCGDKKDDK